MQAEDLRPGVQPHLKLNEEALGNHVVALSRINNELLVLLEQTLGDFVGDVLAVLLHEHEPQTGGQAGGPVIV